ncbi:MAG TPA: helix-turn-helix transcriptional regulator [Caulobacteraceae bacterium]|jgi:transcriptional regulator with XRE-family HTH domain|nr:helix-turn-helix transcriptional regulator [Caulobacteraceae bacterium]
MTDLLESRPPNPVDLHVGARIRLRRRMQGVSQEKLADALGLTFQQVQKYERGANRVSASKLYEIATALQAPVSYFFDGLADPSTDEGGVTRPSDEQTVHTFLMTAEGLELAKLFPGLPRGRIRRRFLDLMRALAGVDDAEDEDREG